MRIIPLSVSSTPHTGLESDAGERKISREAALHIIASNASSLIHSPMIEEEAFYRLRNYPSQIAHSLHYSKVTIPRKLAYILHNLPASIAPAVEAFYLRDPISLKPLQATSSDLHFAPEDLISVSIKFTKVLFAQLKAQQFPAPVVWKSAFTAVEKASESEAKLAQLETGMKLTSGFEMLVTDQKNKDNRQAREILILLEDLEGGEILPSDAEIAKWPNATREDDEKWLDINFEDFENELQGKKGANKTKAPTTPGVFGPEPPPGFGDAKTRDNLRKMVERFEAFLNDDEAGVEGAEEVDEMDIDDDDDDELEDSEDEEEDKEVSFDEEEFARMMREMMGLPSEEVEGNQESSAKSRNDDGGHKIVEVTDDNGSGDTDFSEEDDEESEIRKVMAKMEAELNEAGALDLNPTPRKLAALKGKQPAEVNSQDGNSESDKEEVSDDEVDIDLNLAKNLLESFKSQGGLAGPGGNMLGMMGLQLPRDADDEINRKV